MSPETTDLLQAAAARWYDQHLNEHLHSDRDMAVKRCAAWLFGNYGVAAAPARDTALQALGSVEARSSAAYIDVDRTTSHTLFLIDPATGREFAFTAADLAHVAHGAVDRCPIHAVQHPQSAAAAG